MAYSTRIAVGLLASVSVLAFASVAGAQTAAAAPSEELEGIVVTGSRIIQNGNNMPTPVTVVSTDQLLQTTPSTVIQALTQLPVFSGGRSPITQPGNSSQNNAFRTLNLRNLNANRTLVLFDGQRVPPTSPNGEVNADFVPSMLLKRVDVVTGGASAVYGSDAVAGVVNFITDRGFNGLKFNAQFGVSELNDGEEYKFGIAGGTDLFGGRGHIMGSYEYFNSPGIFNKLKRQWGANVWSMQGAGTAANPFRLVKNTRLNATSFQGNFTNVAGNGPLRDMVFRSNGVLSPFSHGTPTGSSAVESGGDGGYFYNASMQSLYQSDLAYGRFDFDVSDKVRFYAQATGMLSHNKNNHETNEIRNLRISPTNAFLAPQYQQAATAAGITTLTFSKMMTQAPAKQPDTYTRGYMAAFGFEGEVFDDWRWDVKYLNSQNQQRTRNNANPNNGKLFAAMDAVRAPNGTIVCNVTLTHPSLYPGCVPINFFGTTSESFEAIDYVLDVTHYVANTKMDTLAASFAGSPASTWAGEIGVAVSAEWRKLTYELKSDAQPLPLDCTGLRFNCTQGTTLRFQSNVLANRSEVSQSVKEVAGEVSVPLLKDVAFANSFLINGAVRYTDYDTSGTVTTWKLGADWDVNDWIKIRATRSLDIRAPSINELFAPRLINPAGVTDVHTGIVGQAPFITDPNPDLVPEEAKTWTAGIVLRPTFIPRFSLSFDWYKISIANAITNIQGQNPTIQNICEASNGTSPFCDLIQRPLPFSNRTPANFVTAFFSKPQNAQTQKTNGFDIEANWSTPVLEGTMFDGNLALRGLLTHQPDLKSIQFPGAPVLDSGGVQNLSKTRITAFAKYTRGDFTFDVQQRWNEGVWYNSDPALVYAEKPTKDYFVTNVTFGYKRNQVDYYLSIQNLFDRQPTPFGNVGGASGVPGLFGGFIPGEEVVGRYYTVGLRLRR
jgi:outer membrane receptor protein involved in Fe transport